jgi:hypothetical protein
MGGSAAPCRNSLLFFASFMGKPELDAMLKRIGAVAQGTPSTGEKLSHVKVNGYCHEVA